MKKLIAAAIAASMLAGGVAYAASHADPIMARKEAMKAVGGAMGAMGKMAKGEMAFDGAAVLAALQQMTTATQGFGDLFPAGSETGGETTASPKIWEDSAGFNAKLVEFSDMVAAATANPPADQAALGAALGGLGGTCKACHETYRIPKN